MATLLNGQGPIAFGTIGDATLIDTTPAMPLGSRAKDNNGNEYIYLKGCASTVVGSLVVYTTAWQSALLTTSLVGPVAVAMSACLAGNGGWYQIFGFGSAIAVTANINVQTYSSGTSGEFTTTYAAGKQLHGIVTNGSNTAADSAVVVFLSYPWTNVTTDS